MNKRNEVKTLKITNGSECGLRSNTTWVSLLSRRRRRSLSDTPLLPQFLCSF